MKLPLRYLLPAIVAAGTLALVVYARTHQVNFAEHTRFDQRLDSLDLHDSMLDRNVLKARSRLLGDYDSLGGEIDALKVAANEVADMPAFVSKAGRKTFQSKIAEFEALLARKERAIQSFESENAVLNNSLRYLPTASTELLAQLGADEKGQRLIDPVTRLMQLVFVHCLQSGEDETPAIRASLAELARWRAENPAYSQAAAVGRLAAHVGAIVTRKPKVEALTDQLSAIPTPQCIAALHSLYERELAAALHRQDLLRTVLEVLCAVLLPGIGYTIYALTAAKRHLERRVADRTAELSTENAQRRHAEEEQRAAGRFLQSTLDALSSHLAILDADGVIVAVNAAWRDFATTNGALSEAFGAGANYLAVCEAATGSCSAEAKAVAAGLRRVISGEENDFQLEYPCHSPTEQRWFVVRVTCFRSEGALHLVVAHENVTARALAEQTVRESEQRFSGAFEHAPIGVALVSPEGRWLKVNRAVCALVGYSEAELLSRTFQDVTHPEDLDADLENVRRLLAAEIGSYHMEKRYVHARGNFVSVLLHVSLVRDGQGQPLYFISQLQDITASKQTEAALAKAHRELVDASRQAGMAEVATGVLHNVGNVLNSVNVSATLVGEGVKKSKAGNLGRVVTLLESHAGDLGAFLTSDAQGKNLPAYLRQLHERLGEEQRGLLAEVDSLRQNIEHIKDIVSMQQEYAKFSGVTEVLAVKDLIEDSLRLNGAALARHEVEVVREYQDVPPITVEKHKALQVLVNLIRNAKYACDEGGRKDKRMTLRVANGNGRIKISVSDNGIGIPAENLTRIFNHGFTTRAEGHGFGLHSGALAAMELGGALLAHSDGPGLGATFTLELPAA